MPAVTATLIDIAAPTPRSRLLTFDLGRQPFTYAAGQAVRIALHGTSDFRPYSIACAPGHAAATGTLELLIAVDIAGGTDLSWAAPGARVDVDGPLGTFCFPEQPGDHALLFVAGGTGIAPLRAMIGHVLGLQPARTMSVLYSARRSDEFAFIEELRGYEAAGRLALHQTVTRDDGTEWQGRRGRISRSEFEVVLHAPASTLCFVCGPPAMVDEAVTVLSLLGVPAELIRTEQWGK